MLITFRHSLSYFVIGSVPSALHLVTAMQQRTLSNFGVRKHVQMLSGRWLRDPSPDYMRERFPCKTCGQIFKSKQGLASHSKHVHNEVREAKAQDGANPHWAWRFLQGAQPHADDAQEPVVVGGAGAFSTPEKRKRVDRKCGRETRQRYTVTQKLHAVDHWHFARESGLEYNEAVIPSYKKRVSVCEGLHFLFV